MRNVAKFVKRMLLPETHREACNSNVMPIAAIIRA